MDDHPCWYCREVAGEPALVLETLPEPGVHKRLSHGGHDTACNIDAAPGTKGQREIGGNRAEQGAEQLNGPGTARLRSCQAVLRYFLRQQR